MSSFFDRVETYSWDRPLFDKLGLKPFSFENHGKHFVGRVEDEAGWVEITVTGVPAQFWDFTVYSNDSNQTFKFRTGSGSFGDYWPLVEKVMQGMFVPYGIE